MAGLTNVSPVDRFWLFVEKSSDPDGCWNWKGCKVGRPGGGHYGQLRVGGGKVMRAHRFSYELHLGPIPEGLMVLHDCDNPRCVNPAHLYAGTALENADDRRRHGRHRVLSGVAAPWTKVIDLDEVRRLYREEMLSQREIGKRLGVHQTTIHHALKRAA